MARPNTPHARAKDWTRKLHAFIEARRHVPFGWGEQDCCTLGADLVKELIGVDPIAPARGQYHDEASAEVLLAEHGGLEGLAVASAQAAGLPECKPEFVHRGDVALVKYGNHLAVGIVLGVHVAVPGELGLQFVRRSMIQRAWAV